LGNSTLVIIYFIKRKTLGVIIEIPGRLKLFPETAAEFIARASGDQSDGENCPASDGYIRRSIRQRLFPPTDGGSQPWSVLHSSTRMILSLFFVTFLLTYKTTMYK